MNRFPWKCYLASESCLPTGRQLRNKYYDSLLIALQSVEFPRSETKNSDATREFAAKHHGRTQDLFQLWNRVDPLVVSVLYTGHEEQKNKWKNKENTMKEQCTKKSNSTFKGLILNANKLMIKIIGKIKPRACITDQPVFYTQLQNDCTYQSLLNVWNDISQNLEQLPTLIFSYKTLECFVIRLLKLEWP